MYDLIHNVNSQLLLRLRCGDSESLGEEAVRCPGLEAVHLCGTRRGPRGAGVKLGSAAAQPGLQCGPPTSPVLRSLPRCQGGEACRRPLPGWRPPGPSRPRRRERGSPPGRQGGSASGARPAALGPEPPLGVARALHAHPAQAALALRARRRPAHPDALQHPDPLLFVHSEGHPSGLAALGAPHGRRRAGRRPRDPTPEQPGGRRALAPKAHRASLPRHKPTRPRPIGRRRGLSQSWGAGPRGVVGVVVSTARTALL